MKSNGNNPNDWTPVDFCQVKTVVGLIFLFDVYRSQHELLRLLWSSGISGRPIFAAAFGRNTFEQIVAYLRLDIRKNQSQRDKFAPFRQFWN